MSHRTRPVPHPITLELDGESIPACEGEPVAVSVIAAGQPLFSRSPKYHRARGAFCLSGGCGQCLMRVDGVPNVATCRLPATPGLRLERQTGFPDADDDLLVAVDLVFRTWFDHHAFLTSVPLGDKVLMQVAKRLAGLGALPDRCAPARPPAVRAAVDVAIVGGGVAGLSAAARLAERGVPWVLFEAEPRIGDAAVAALAPPGAAPSGPAGTEVRCSASVLGLYADEGPRFLAVLQHGRLHLVFPRVTLLANGGHAALPTFANNDLPGIYAGSALRRLLADHGVLPGRRVAVCGQVDGTDDEARALAALVTHCGGEALAVGLEPVAARGTRRVRAIDVRTNRGIETIACDAVAVCALPNPAHELAAAAGARVCWSPAQGRFLVEADEHGRTACADVYVAGALRGASSLDEAARQGARAADGIADSWSRGSAEASP